MVKQIYKLQTESYVFVADQRCVTVFLSLRCCALVRSSVAVTDYNHYKYVINFLQIQRLNFIVAFYTNKPRRYTSKLSNIHEQTRTYNSSKNSNSLI